MQEKRDNKIMKTSLNVQNNISFQKLYVKDDVLKLSGFDRVKNVLMAKAEKQDIFISILKSKEKSSGAFQILAKDFSKKQEAKVITKDLSLTILQKAIDAAIESLNKKLLKTPAFSNKAQDIANNAKAYDDFNQVYDRFDKIAEDFWGKSKFKDLYTRRR